MSLRLQLRRNRLRPPACESSTVVHTAATPGAAALIVYQHDGADTFRFVLRGKLTGESVEELRHAWTTAASVTQGKQLVIDLSWLLDADADGVELLRRMEAAGGRFIAPMPPVSAYLTAALNLPHNVLPESGPKGAWNALSSLFRTHCPRT
jgi:hypothetical protein